MGDERLTTVDAGPLEGGPPPSAWKRVRRRGAIASTAGVTFYPWLEANAAATNFDVIVDWTASPGYTPDVNVYAAIYAFSLAGSGKVYRAQYQMSPSGGIAPTAARSGTILNPAWSQARQSGGIGGTQFIIQAGGLAALGWGLELACTALTFGDGLSNLLAVGIAHGRETSYAG